MSRRREFLAQMGVIAASLSFARIPAGAADRAPDVFVEVGHERISGARALADRGFAATVTPGVYPGGKTYAISVRNTGKKTERIDRIGMLLAPPGAAKSRRWRVFLDIGASGFCGVKRLDALEADRRLQPVHERNRALHRSDLQALAWDAASHAGFLAGFLAQRNGRNKIDVVPNEKADDITSIEPFQEFALDVAPGGSLHLDALAVAAGSDPFAMLETFGTAVMQHQARSFDRPPVVGMMTWYGYRTAIDEELVLENAKIVGELFGGYPQKMQPLMICDHGWQQDANWGYWKPDKERFPHGMKWLSGQLASHGLGLGLWYTPFCITGNAANYPQLAPLRALDADGKPRQSKAAVWGDLPGQPGTWPIAFLDAGRDEVQKLWRDTFAEMKSWGTQYWKLDFFALQTSASNASKVGAGELYAKTWKTFREAAGDNASLNPCSCPTNLQLGYDDSARIAADIGNAGGWPGAMKGYRYGMATVAALWYKNRKFWVNDADSIQFAKGCSLAEARIRATVVAFSGGHLMVSEDLREVSPERLEMIRRLIPPYPIAARPLDLFEHPFPEGYPSLWALPLKTGFGPATALAAFNLASESREFEIRPEMLGIAAGREFMALEWWQCKWLGRFNGAFRVRVPAEDVAVIHAQPVRDVPWMLSVSHHITGGYIVEDVSFDERSGALKGELVTKAGLKAVLFGHSPEKWQLGRQATFHAISNSIGGWQAEVLTTGMRTPFAVQFQKA